MEKKPIEENAVAPAEIKYSNWKLIDLVGEYSKTCKNIDKCILSFVGVRKKWDWDCALLITHIDGIGENEKIRDAITNQTPLPNRFFKESYSRTR